MVKRIKTHSYLALFDHFGSQAEHNTVYSLVHFFVRLTGRDQILYSEEISGLVNFGKMVEMLSFTAYRQFLQFLIAVFFFHTSEYFLVLFIHGKDSVNLNSLLISKSYMLAMFCSMVEFIVELYFFPGMKDYWLISNVGLVMVIFGELIRKMAIVTAGKSFTHIIRRYHEDNHKLVTHGIYAHIRHPSYCGFFIWAVGTQVMLCNPLSTLAFAVVVWQFFHERIPYEEFFLKRFFGDEYEEYARRTPSGVPFIR